MTLTRLQIQDFRNITSARLEFSPGCNLITGANAAGKTSILEAIHFLARVRSFRTHRSEQLIREGAESFRLVGTLRDGERDHPVGLQRGRKEMQIRLDGAPVRRVSELASRIPLVSMTSDLHRVLEEGPKYRRQFIDWGLFHVEPDFHATWTQYAHALKQRNAILRKGGAESQVRAWDPGLLAAGERLHTLRVAYLQMLEPLFTVRAEEILGLGALGFRYTPGWARTTEYAPALADSLERDREQGFTRIGPHRADLQFLHEEQDLRERLSRGQQKQLVTALLLAQAELLRQRRDQRCLFLIDDLPAELDPEHQGRVLAELQKLGAQAFITAIETQSLDLSEWDSLAWFHVEQGMVRSGA